MNFPPTNQTIKLHMHIPNQHTKSERTITWIRLALITGLLHPLVGAPGGRRRRRPGPRGRAGRGRGGGAGGPRGRRPLAALPGGRGRPPHAVLEQRRLVPAPMAASCASALLIHTERVVIRHHNISESDAHCSVFIIRTPLHKIE